MRVIHSRTQHAVGQGGFHSAVVSFGSKEFRYVYDCGSHDANRLSACIRQLADDTRVLDTLFLSHLDQDHTNGVDQLLGRVDVRTVVLPYLSPFERLEVLVEAIANPVSTFSATSFFAMVADPVAWFFDRGVARVLLVRSSENGPPIPEATAPREGSSPDESSSEESPPDEIERADVDDGGAQPLSADSVRSFGRKAATAKVLTSRRLRIVDGGNPIWELVPFVQPEGPKEDAFRTAVAKILGFRKAPATDHPQWIDRLKDAIRTRQKRDELAAAYKLHIWKDRNLSTMCLYSGPIAPSTAQVGISYSPNPRTLSWRAFIRSGHHLDTTPIGWIGTGDAHLDRKKRWEAFKSYYASRLDRAGTIMVPHHGSRHNQHPGLFTNYPGRLWAVSYGRKNRYGHPDRHVVAMARVHGIVALVNERPRTALHETFALEY